MYGRCIFILFSLSLMQVNSAQTLIFCCFMDRVIHQLMRKTVISSRFPQAGGQQSPGWADVPPLLIREPFKPASCSDSCPFLSYAVRAADSRMKTLMVQKPPPPLSLLFRTGKQSDLRLITLLLSIDCAALPSSVLRREKWHKHFDSYLYLFSSPWRAEE